MRTISVVPPPARPATASASASTSGEDDVARLRLAVVRLSRRIRQNARTGVTPSQLSALATLDRHGPLQPAQLAEHEGVGRSTVTRIARGLEEAGLVVRTPDPEDGRCSILDLTADGRELLAASRGRAEAYLAERVATLGPDDLALLERVSAVLERLADRG